MLYPETFPVPGVLLSEFRLLYLAGGVAGDFVEEYLPRPFVAGEVFFTEIVDFILLT
jgi:hypothetical protein